ncbi:MAG TPA: M48 family metallopeptidase [Mycobacteriales bacterium]|jgi:Zn-dependent protease with chaperone function|nr:M48 family metallopeptidase [Mycobacteriales bacterium]
MPIHRRYADASVPRRLPNRVDRRTVTPVTSSTPDRSRVLLPDLSPRAYEHPSDRAALSALRKIRGFDQVLHWLSGLFAGRSPRLLALASTVRVEQRQFPDILRLIQDGARILDLPDVPDAFVTNNPIPNIATVGIDKPFLVINSGLVDLLDEEELRFVIGHELGHVLSGHAVYRTMLNALLTLSRRVFFLPVGYLGLRALITALEEWYRKSEVSCDRAGLLAAQDPEAALRALMKVAGGARLAEMDVTAFLEQAREYDAQGDLRDGVLKLLSLQGQLHPFAVLRAADLRRWVDDGSYQAILDGDYPRRGEEHDASVGDDAREAAKSYKQTMDESADALMGLLRGLGEEAASVGQRVADRIWPKPADADPDAETDTESQDTSE